MKTFIALVTVLAFSAGLASAQSLNGTGVASVTSTQTTTPSDVTGFKAPLAPGVNPASLKTPPNPNVVLKPKLGGVFVDGGKYGAEIINPLAPVTYGMGEKYLSAPSSRYDLQHESGPAAHRTSGGLKLFSLEF